MRLGFVLCKALLKDLRMEAANDSDSNKVGCIFSSVNRNHNSRIWEECVSDKRMS